MAFKVDRVGEYPAPCLIKKKKKDDSEPEQSICRPYLIKKKKKDDSEPEQSIFPVGKVYHVSVDQSGAHLWISNERGHIQKVNTRIPAEENLLQIKTSGEMEGYHAATEDGGLIYADKANRVIYRMQPGGTRNEFAGTEDWEPLSLHLSRINGDLLVGMIRQGEAKVTRYNMTGAFIKNIQRDIKGRVLYEQPNYITENINGDICTSDKSKVVLVDSSGKKSYFYPDNDSKFRPFGICTDKTGHILVSDLVSQSVHVLNQDGSYLSSILSPQGDLSFVFGICVVDSNNYICVGQYDKVIRYTQN
uniref:Uncharacterized protein LOC111136280 n=1 Tax=Crassostrea virginica TaxID=6565 RepID=A0A8B8ESK9_CRAVI|nr:uncharacterized protein LOC111136280 [Crassostrea virginica]